MVGQGWFLCYIKPTVTEATEIKNTFMAQVLDVCPLLSAFPVTQGSFTGQLQKTGFAPSYLTNLSWTSSQTLIQTSQWDVLIFCKPLITVNYPQGRNRTLRSELDLYDKSQNLVLLFRKSSEPRQSGFNLPDCIQQWRVIPQPSEK